MSSDEFDSDLEMSDGENYSPSPAPKAKAKPAPKAAPRPAAAPKAAAAKPASKKQPLGETTNTVTAAAAAPKGGKAIEDIYQKKTQLEHILLRPDTYIGSTEKQQQTLWVHNGEKMEYKAITYAPGLYKIFDEILVNAADNKVRDPSMDTLKVDIDAEQNTIRVWNSGDGIPVEMHKTEGVYVPELIFGHLLTSSNYDDNEKKIVGGRNGYGAKLANIFSTEFTVETCDGKRQRRFLQTFRANMSTKTDPVIKPCKASDNWTCITFSPDLAKFDMAELEEDVLALMRKRVYDVAGVLGKGCKVFLNGVKLPIKSFSDYVDLYLGPKDNSVARVYERIGDRWEVCFSGTDGQFQQVSFVNSICTTKGGTHVNHITDQVSKFLVEKLNKKHKNAQVKPFMVKNHLWVFVNTSIENPAFDSQTKETLTTRVSSFGSKCELPAPLLKKIGDCGIMDSILSFAEFKSQKELKKGDGAKRARLTGIAKLSDANDAGTRNSQQCTLILTEGDSAKALAMAGLSVVGHDHYGVFPLRGKLLNVRDATASQISDNVEINHIKQILGLQHGKQYEDTKALRYGHLMIMTDQDHDGSHIKGLIMNFLHTFYPSLLRIPGFLVEFITPIIRAKKGTRVQSFYTMPEYEAWREGMSDGAAAGWDIKYYKGLGTSTNKEAKEYFAAMEAHRKRFVWEGDEDATAIEMAFSKKRVEDRKKWLREFVPGTYLDQSVKDIGYTDFVNKELILFSRADLERSIPSMVDGLKPGQRKIMYACFKSNLAYNKKEIRVVQLSGDVLKYAAYHHGEASLQTTIVGLAQDFVGSNNINLLFPAGQFGTRLQGGKDAASARYIMTKMAPLTRHIFNKADDKLLSFQNEEGQIIEPEWYMPILPMVLVNGAEGIGTGWSTFIPNYSPREIVANLKHLLRGEALEPMQPWYRGFKGSITEAPTKSAVGRSYTISGVISKVGDATLDITELPIRKWTQDYKEYLETMLKPAAKEAGARGAAASNAAPAEPPLIVDYKEFHTDTTVHFSLELAPGRLTDVMAAGLDARFKLTTKVSTGNMMLFDRDGKIKHYETPEAIMSEFFDVRLDFYERRRLSMLQDAQWEQLRADNKMRFILAVIKGELVVSNRKKAEIEVDLEAAGYDRMAKKRAAGPVGDATDDAEGGAGSATAAAGARETYDYLLSMPIYSLTWEKVQELQAEAATAAAEVALLEQADIKEMWDADLDSFLEAYEAWEAEEEASSQQLAAQQRKARKAKGKGAAGKKGGAAGKGKKANPWSDGDGSDDDGDDDDFMDEDQPRKAAPKARKAPAPKPAAAPKPAKPPTSTLPTAPAYTMPTAAPPKPGAAKATAAKAVTAAAAGVPAAVVEEKAGPSAAAVVEEEEPMDLAARLKKMAIKSNNSSAISGPANPTAGTAAAAVAAAAVAAAAKKAPRRAATAKRPVVIDGSDSDGESADSEPSESESESDSEPEFMSPAPQRPKAAAAKPKAGAAGAAAPAAAAKAEGAKAAAAGAAAKAVAARVASASPSPNVAFGRTITDASVSPAVARRAAAEGALKRKPRGKRVVDSDDENAPSSSYDAPTPSPALMRQKNRKIAVSPMPVPKALAPGRSKAPAAAKAAKPAAVAPAAAPSAAAAAAGLSAATGAARPARARKPAVVYVESDDDDVMVLSDDSGSDYAASD